MYQNKYIKYKNKYLELKLLQFGGNENIVSKKLYLMYYIDKNILSDLVSKFIKPNTHITLATFVIDTLSNNDSSDSDSVKYLSSSDIDLESDEPKIKNYNDFLLDIHNRINMNKQNILTKIRDLYKTLFDDFNLSYNDLTILSGDNDTKFLIASFKPSNNAINSVKTFEIEIIKIILEFIIPNFKPKSIKLLSRNDIHNLKGVPDGCTHLVIYKIESYEIIFYLYQSNEFHISLTKNPNNFDSLKKVTYNDIDNFLSDDNKLVFK
jgi:hypothetical protein